jgi:hypothetical protein
MLRSAATLLILVASSAALGQESKAPFLTWGVFDGTGTELKVGNPALSAGPAGRFSVERHELQVLDSKNQLEALVTFQAIYDSDPFISFSISAVDLGAPSVFFFGFGTPLSPAVPSPTLVKSSFSGTLTDAQGDGGFVTPSGQPVLMAGTLDPGGVNMGVDLGAGLALGAGSPGQVANTGVLFDPGPTAASYAPGPAGGPWSFMNMTVQFSLSGSLDAFSATGFAEILPVPEPSTYALLLAGLALLGFALRHNKKHRWQETSEREDVWPCSQHIASC